MSRRSSSPAFRRPNGGFALIIVLWTLVLIAFIVVHLTANARTEIRIASNLVANAVAQAAADGAIFEAIFNQSDPQPDQRWPVDGKARELTIGNSRVTLRLDYGPPVAPLETLDELGRVLGMTPATLAAIRPHLTLFGPPQPSAATTDPVVAAALAESPQATTASSPAQPPPDVLTTRITATAFSPNNARVTRSAIVRLGTVLPSGYEILAWGNGMRLAD